MLGGRQHERPADHTTFRQRADPAVPTGVARCPHHLFLGLPPPGRDIDATTIATTTTRIKSSPPPITVTPLAANSTSDSRSRLSGDAGRGKGLWVLHQRFVQPRSPCPVSRRSSSRLACCGRCLPRCGARSISTPRCPAGSRPQPRRAVRLDLDDPVARCLDGSARSDSGDHVIGTARSPRMSTPDW